jgi:hypothetical protein
VRKTHHRPALAVCRAICEHRFDTGCREFDPLTAHHSLPVPANPQKRDDVRNCQRRGLIGFAASFPFRSPTKGRTLREADVPPVEHLTCIRSHLRDCNRTDGSGPGTYEAVAEGIEDVALRAVAVSGPVQRREIVIFERSNRW